MNKITRRVSLLFLLSIFGISCSAPKNLEFLGYKGLEIKDGGSGNSILHLELEGYNPNPIKMQVKNASINIFVNNRLLGNFLQDSQVDIPAKDTFYFPLTMPMNLNALLANTLGINWGEAVTVKAIGNCKIGKRGFFLNYPVNYSDTRKWKIF